MIEFCTVVCALASIIFTIFSFVEYPDEAVMTSGFTSFPLAFMLFGLGGMLFGYRPEALLMGLVAIPLAALMVFASSRRAAAHR